MHPVDLVQLRTFIATAEEQNLTKAAERLHLSLSAASAHIKAVEQNLGVQLFNRINRSLELSPHGEVLLSRAKALLNDASTFSSYARSLSDRVCGRVAVSSIADPADSRIGAIAATVLKQHPLVKMTVHIRHAMGTTEGLKTGELDLGMTLGEAIDPALSYIHLTTFRYRVVGPITWRDRVEDAELASLAMAPWIAFTDKHLAYPKILERLFSGHEFENNVVARTDNHMLARAMAESGIGLTLLPEPRAFDSERAGLLCISRKAIAEYDFFVAYLRNRENDPLIGAVIGAIKKIWPTARPTRRLDTE
ncbi:LysR family transcriptional regulator [Candidimonas nitroreducens]|uniref:LysR family transcriptional regulator n=1 Tax=Candidimonas nitroreducens TaxID=683354 RepID=A0A225MDA2_9BURK|nr:LysR family transcriptional regulator [Candidimonas nitroreducens]OWT57561.1 LysR family transcriptional regulator [Candidimonas nitroreducens]